MSFWTAIGLIFKYLPILLEIAKNLEEKIDDAYVEFRVNQQNKKIDYIFSQKAKDTVSAQERARQLDELFKN